MEERPCDHGVHPDDTIITDLGLIYPLSGVKIVSHLYIWIDIL